MKKRNVTLLAVVMLLALSTLVACSSSSSSPSTNDSDDSKKIKFTSFQTGDVEKDWEENRIPAFKEETGIDVEHVFVNHTDTISTLLMWNSAGTMPDAGMLSANYQSALAARGMLVNLTEFIEMNDPDYDLDRFFPNLLDAYKYNGNLYALPSDLDLGLLWYNKDLFDAANVDYPNENWTWNDYLEAAQKLTSGSGPEKIFGTEFPSVQTFLWQNGADFISPDGTESTIDSPEAIEALTFIADLANLHEVAPRPGSEESLFQSGKAAMAHGPGPWYAFYVLEDVDFN